MAFDTPKAATQITTNDGPIIVLEASHQKSQNLTPSLDQLSVANNGAPCGDTAKPTALKKKKKKKGKKSAKAKTSVVDEGKEDVEHERPPVLCISRNKHWKYISSYHVRLYNFSPLVNRSYGAM